MAVAIDVAVGLDMVGCCELAKAVKDGRAVGKAVMSVLFAAIFSGVDFGVCLISCFEPSPIPRVIKASPTSNMAPTKPNPLDKPPEGVPCLSSESDITNRGYIRALAASS